MFRLKTLTILGSKTELTRLPEGKLLINTINAYSYVTALKDDLFAEALVKGDALLPDGWSTVVACRWLKAKSQPRERVAGWNLFEYEMARLEQTAATEGTKRVMFVGSSEKVLALIKGHAATDYPHLEVVTYSPPYKREFSEEENKAMVDAINRANPDLLWVGMTAPKQEKWTYAHWNELNIHCHAGTVGAVFDFYAGTKKRAPKWWQDLGMEWLFRLLMEPRRMWHRYIIGNIVFLWKITKEARE